MYTTTYQLTNLESVLSHFSDWQPLVRDGVDTRPTAPDDDFGSSDDISDLLSRARAQSGDYFMTLATELDKLAQGLATADAPEAPELERLISELLYIDKNYKLTKM